MHADRPGDRPRLLYWYRTAPGLTHGRSPLDEDAIRTIEDSHPDIDFDWPAILALAEVMTPEDEAPAPRPQQQPRQGKRPRGREQRPQPPPHQQPSASAPEPVRSAFAPESPEELRRDDGIDESPDAANPVEEAEEVSGSVEIPPARNLLVEELAGREIGSRLRARYADILGRIQALDVDGSVKDAWFTRAEAIDPELWMTPESVLEGVRNADAQYEKLRAELQPASRE